MPVQTASEDHDPAGISIAPLKSKAEMNGNGSVQKVGEIQSPRGDGALSLEEIIQAIEQTGAIYRQHIRSKILEGNRIMSVKLQAAHQILKHEPGWNELTNLEQFAKKKKLAPSMELPFEYEYMQYALDAAEQHKDVIGRRMEQFAKALPVYEWVKNVSGFGAVNLAVIISEAGNLSDYLGCQRLRKRMGLMPGQRRIAAKSSDVLEKAKQKAAAIDAGYSPRRRSVMHILGDCLIKGNKGKYKAIYEGRKASELEKGEVLVKGQLEKMTVGWAHKRAMRVMEQQVLNDLWGAWTKLHGISERAKEFDKASEQSVESEVSVTLDEYDDQRVPQIC
jgi:hypothetical protein